MDRCPDDPADATWANCSVPDCEYKVCLWLSEDKCYNHALGRTPPDPAVYFGREEP